MKCFMLLMLALCLTASAQTTAPLTTMPSAYASADAGGWMSLFNGKDLANFYTYQAVAGKNSDTQHFFVVEDGMLHFMNLPAGASPQESGYLATNDEFRNYQVRLQYRWGEKKYPVPRHPEPMARDSGLLYHVRGADHVWPQGIEFQIQEQNVGDIWLLNNGAKLNAFTSSATTQPDRAGIYPYQSGGNEVAVPSRAGAQRIIHGAKYEQPEGWNDIELFATGNSAVQVVNGHVASALTGLRVGDVPLAQGRLALQAQFNEVWFRNFEIRPLFNGVGGPDFKVLVFSKTGGFRHASIPDGISAIRQIGAQNHFAVDASEDASAFTSDNLKQYQAVVFLSTTGDILDDAQKQAFEDYIHAGGGYAGVHSASDTEYHWDWYGKLVGAYFSAHPSGTPLATVRLEDADNPLVSSLPMTWTCNDEWYNFRTNPRANVHVLATVDESTYKGGTMGQDHPVIWYHAFEGGRGWYSALGHTKESFADPLFLMQLRAGILYAAGRSSLPPENATVLFNGKDASHWLSNQNRTIDWPIHDRALESKPRAGDIHTVETFDDFQLHVEFKVNAALAPHTRNAITNEQAMGNSGVYMQGRYEAQIIDSFDHPLADMNDIGAIYGIKDALVNASQPAETWQTYDITFHEAKWDGSRKVASARATIYLNGVLVQNDTEITHFTTKGLPEAPGPGPIVLQDHLNPVQFRNIWIKRL